MKERVHVVKGIARHFTGDCEISIIAVRKEERDARMAGSEWVTDQNERFRAEGRNVHASYEIIVKDLQ